MRPRARRLGAQRRRGAPGHRPRARQHQAQIHPPRQRHVRSGLQGARRAVSPRGAICLLPARLAASRRVGLLHVAQISRRHRRHRAHLRQGAAAPRAELQQKDPLCHLESGLRLRLSLRADDRLRGKRRAKRRAHRAQHRRAGHGRRGWADHRRAHQPRHAAPRARHQRGRRVRRGRGAHGG